MMPSNISQDEEGNENYIPTSSYGCSLNNTETEINTI